MLCESFLKKINHIRISSGNKGEGAGKDVFYGSRIDYTEAGKDMYRLIEELYPICRSITGQGVRETLRHVSRQVPIEIHEVPTGTQAFDWTVPKEWNIRDAYILNGSGERLIDFRLSNLHVLNYSRPFRGRVPLGELREHLFSLPEKPDWIPYRTSYYKENWGFCVSQRQADALREPEYEVCIDADLKDGNLTYGECIIQGKTDQEVLLSCHICHPSLCNDNLSGIALTTWLARHMMGKKHRYTYRFLFIPGTIGAIVWLSRNENIITKVRHGLVVACVGDSGKPTYKKSRRGDAEIDRVVLHVLKARGSEFSVREFNPYGYDERQYCSPGFDLPVGSLTRSPHGAYPEYHTSGDDLNLVRPECLADSLSIYLDVIEILEANLVYKNLCPKCEPQLGKRGLYRSLGGPADAGDRELAMLWVLNMSDEKHSLLDIGERSGLTFRRLCEAADLLMENGLLTKCL
jgi:aminopeptidase-like protein